MQEMLINVVPGEEVRIALLADGKLDDFFQERASVENHVGGIYKGRIRRVEQSVQAAFVDIGLPQNAFLHASDVHPRYFPGAGRDTAEKVGEKISRRERPPIQECFRKGDEVLVQVIKEGIGTKGPMVTSYLSLPGRFLVMMPGMEEVGVSKKLEDFAQRDALRDMLRELELPEGFGFIARTEAAGRTKTELKRDLAYLQRVWKGIEQKRKNRKGLGELYTESDLVIRTLRDVYTDEVARIVVDDLESARRCRDFLKATSPKCATEVLYYADEVPLFHRRKVEHQIQLLQERTVPLPSGGALVIDQTEAMVAIDVNSGRSRSAGDAEENAFETNMEAVEEICRQVRLRDLGGIVCLDLIDMIAIKHRKKVEARLKDLLKRDRAKTRIGMISPVCGVLPMTRQRMRASLNAAMTTGCPHCDATGRVSTGEAMANKVLRRLTLALMRQDVARVDLTVSGEVAFILLNAKRPALSALEQTWRKPVMIRVGGRVGDLDLAAYADTGAKVASDVEKDLRHLPAETATTLRKLDDPSLPPDEGSEFRDDELIRPLAAEVEEEEAREAAEDEAKEAEAGGDETEEGADEAPAKPAPRPERREHRERHAERPPREPRPQRGHAPEGGAPRGGGHGRGLEMGGVFFPGLQKGQKPRLREVAAALGLEIAELIRRARGAKFERLQNPETRVSPEEVAKLVDLVGRPAGAAAPAETEGGSEAGTRAETRQEDRQEPRREARPERPRRHRRDAEQGDEADAQVAVAEAELEAEPEPAAELPPELAGHETLRVHQLAEHLKVRSADVLAAAKHLKIAGLRTASSSLPAPDALRLLASMGGGDTAKTMRKPVAVANKRKVFGGPKREGR